MALINRVSRLFKADLHAVLDRIEEPEALLKQSVREMEEALTRDRRRNQSLQRERSEIQAREKELSGALTKLDEELETCFEFDRDDLARRQIKRKLELERQQKTYRRRREELEELLQRQQRRIEENAVRLQSMRQKAELLATDGDEEAGGAGQAMDVATDFGVSDEEVEVAFLREKQRRARR